MAEQKKRPPVTRWPVFCGFALLCYRIVRKFKKGKNIPYYPIPTKKNHEHYLKYEELAKGYQNLHMLGRLGMYKYLDMDDAVKNAMLLYEEITGDTVDFESIEPIKK